MAIAHFLVPYVHSEGSVRTLPIDSRTPEILAADGWWSEAEIDGDRALVRVRAPDTLLTSLGLDHARVTDPEASWTPTRLVPINRGEEVAFDSGERHACRTLADLASDVLDEAGWAQVKKQAEALMLRADAQGYVRIDKMPWPRAARLLSLVARHGYPLDRISAGTFPTTGILDAFNRTNEGPPPSASWTTGMRWTDGISVISNQVGGATANNQDAYWNTSVGPDSEVYMTFAVDAASDSLGLRGKEPGATTQDGYILFKQETAPDTLSIRRRDNGGATALGANMSQEIADGDALGHEAIGSTLTGYYKASGGSWATLGSRTDATYGAAGNIWLELLGATVRGDDFGGGTVVVPGSLVIPHRSRRSALLRM